LIDEWLALLATEHADFTLTFRALTHAAGEPSRDPDVKRLLSPTGSLDERFDAWAKTWRDRLRHEPGAIPASAQRMREKNPAYIARNHRVEEALAAAHEGDLAPFETLVELLQTPFEEHPDRAHFAAPPAPEERVTATFCGT
jgi:uncharacterized protein YdiU (UPF0061 family)